MRFESPEALGIWASTYSASRVEFGDDGAIKCVEFAGNYALPASDVDGAPNPDREVVNAAAKFLARAK